MAILNLLELQPTTISRDLSNKYLLLYGRPKCGKTSFAAQCPNNLILCFEKGVNFLPGIYAADMEKWSDFKALLRQLSKTEVKGKFKTVTIDTVSLAWSLCERYICDNNGVNAISDIPWGKGYALLKDEFSSALRKISMMGYGIILITHAKIRLEKIDDEHSVEVVSPNIPERAQDVINALVDIIGYIDYKPEEGGTAKRDLITRETPTIVAGSRLKYLPPRIPFGYHELVNAIGEAIEKQGEVDGAKITDEIITQKVIKERPYSEAIAEARELWFKLVGNGEGEPSEQNMRNREEIAEKIVEIFGQPMKLSEVPESALPSLEILIEEMRNM